MPGRIIEFERRPDFYFRCAKERFDSGEYAESLMPALRAVSAESTRAEYLLLLAGIYSKLGWRKQSAYILTKALLLGADVNMALYISGENLFASGSIEEAKNVLAQSGLKEADRLHSDICLAEELNTPYKRRPRRALHWASLGCDYLDSGKWTLAVRSLEKYTKLCPGESAGRLLLAKALASAGDHASALVQAENAVKDGEARGKAGILYAQVLSQTGKHAEAAACLSGIDPEAGDIAEEINYIIALAAEGMHEKIHAFAQEGLRGGRVDLVLANALSVSAMFMGMNADEINRGWEKILAADPGHPVASYMVEECEKGARVPVITDYLFETTADCRLKMYKDAAEANNEEIIDVCARLAATDTESAVYGLNLLAARGTDDCRRLISLISVMPELSTRVREEAGRLAAAAGIEFPREYRKLRKACLQSYGQILPEIDARSAKIVTDATYNNADPDTAARLWRGFVRNGGKNVSANADAACAALICASNLRKGLKPDYRKLMREYDLRPRQLKRVLKPLYKYAGITEDVENAF